MEAQAVTDLQATSSGCDWNKTIVNTPKKRDHFGSRNKKNIVSAIKVEISMGGDINGYEIL